LLSRLATARPLLSSSSASSLRAASSFFSSKHSFSSSSSSTVVFSPSLEQQKEKEQQKQQVPRGYSSSAPASPLPHTIQAYGDTTKRTSDDPARKAFQYFMVGGIGVTGGAIVKNIVVDAITTMLPSADVLALASVEVDLSGISEGETVVISWRGKPLFVRHRTAQDISDAKAVNLGELRDPQPDETRVQKPEWLVMLGVCTHLGCVPINGSGDYNGWFCPCHGSHYDTSGRIRKGPAPLNLEIPPYKFLDDTKLLVG